MDADGGHFHVHSRSSGPSGGSLYGGASFKIEKLISLHEKGPENLKNEVNPALCRPYDPLHIVN